MQFNSLVFAIFAILFFIGWPVLRKNKNTRWIYLVCASFLFYGWWDWRFLFLIIGSGFNEKKFISQFEQADGTWINVALAAYTSFDGSHLQRESAERFSNDFVKLFNKAMNNQTNQLTKKTTTSGNCDSVKGRNYNFT